MRQGDRRVAQERLSMRKIRDVLRLRAAGFSGGQNPDRNATRNRGSADAYVGGRLRRFQIEPGTLKATAVTVNAGRAARGHGSARGARRREDTRLGPGREQSYRFRQWPTLSAERPLRFAIGAVGVTTSASQRSGRASPYMRARPLGGPRLKRVRNSWDEAARRARATSLPESL